MLNRFYMIWILEPTYVVNYRFLFLNLVAAQGGVGWPLVSGCLLGEIWALCLSWKGWGGVFFCVNKVFLAFVLPLVCAAIEGYWFLTARAISR